ncbi:MAG TPA: PASTA domain-containing protein [Bacteroidetes bacterium]|nr:PASTA domain-containing protein [Bacteroidota bacterium]
MKPRLTIFIILNMLILIVWIGYLFSIQILDAHHLKSRIEIRKNPSKKIIIPFRGNIYDRNNNLLVSSVKYYQIDIDVNAIELYCRRNDRNKDQILQEISRIIAENSNLSEKKIYRKLIKANTSSFISENISEVNLFRINEYFTENNIPGLIPNFSKSKRTYPQDKLASTFLGVVEDSKDQDSEESIYKVTGVSGLESTYNDKLKGKYGWQETIHDANNRRIPFLFLKERPATNGNSLVLTIDNHFQEILEESLSKGITDYKAKNAIGIIMHPQTGEIVAMAGINEKDKYRSRNELLVTSNKAVSFMFEPGSTLKPITALMALEKKIYTPSDKIDCRDYHLEYGKEKRVIKDDHKYKFLSFKDIIAYSSNVGISKIVERIGNKELYERMIALGFGHKTGSNLSGEASGILRKVKDWQGFSLHSISFGQEISVTAIQLANAYCTLANGGKVMQPYIVKEVVDENGNIVEKTSPKILRQISDERSLDTLKVFLKSVVDYGTATGTRFDYLDVAGKTGTGEKAVYGEHGYTEEKYTAVFAGFFPVEKPEYVMVIVYDEPDYSSYAYYASISAVPTFKNIITRILNLPDSKIMTTIKEQKKEFVFAPAVLGLSRDEAEKILIKKGISYEIFEKSPDGKVVNQFPKPNAAYDKNENLIVILDNQAVTEDVEVFDYAMPDLKGMTLRKALALANKKNIKLIVKGSGIVYKQSISPGTKTKFGEKCQIRAR